MNWSDFDESEQFISFNLSNDESKVQQAEWLRTLRKKCGFTQEYIAKMTQRSRPMVSAWENTNLKNHRGLDYRDIYILCDIYKIPATLLLMATTGNDRRSMLLNGYIVNTERFHSVNKKPVYIDGENGCTGWAIVDNDTRYLLFSSGEKLNFDDLRSGFFCSRSGPIDYKKRKKLIESYGKSRWMSELLIQEWPEWCDEMSDRVMVHLKKS